jgi:uncharacterized protein involved in exopolysaccharide biosynthesis
LEINQQASHSLSEEISFKEILVNIAKINKYIISKWKIILIMMVIGGISGFIWASQKKLKYVATSTFLLQDPGAAQSSSYDLPSFIGFRSPEGGNLFQGENLIQLYQTRFMIKKTLLSKIPDSNNEYLIERYLKINNLKQVWALTPNLKNVNFFRHYDKKEKKKIRTQDSLMTNIINDIRFNYLSVSMAGRLNIMKVEVRSQDEEFAKLLNDQIVNTVNDFYIQTKTKKSLDNVRLLKHQTDSITQALNGSMYRTASSVMVNSNPARETLRLPTQRGQVVSEINRAMLNELTRDLEVSKMALRKETPLIQMMDEPVFPLEKEKINAVKWAIIGAVAFAMLSFGILSLIYIYNKILQQP